MTIQEVITRLGKINIQDAEVEDYMALYIAIDLIGDIEDKEIECQMKNT